MLCIAHARAWQNGKKAKPKTPQRQLQAKKKT